MSSGLENYRFFSLYFPFFIVWIESNKDSFLFDVIKLLRPDLGVRVNFFPSIAGSYHQISHVRHSFKLHSTSFFLHTEEKMVGGRGENRTEGFSFLPTGPHLHHHGVSGLMVLLILTPGSLKPSNLPTCSPVLLITPQRTVF